MTPETRHRLPLLKFLATGSVLSVWVISTALVYFALAAPDGSNQQFFAVSLVLIVAIFFTGYCFDVIEQTALGHPEAPAFNLSISRLGPRLIRMLVYLSMLALLIQVMPEPLEWLAISVALGVTPAVSSFIVFHEPLLKSINPFRLWQFVSNMGLTYITLRLVTTSVLVIGLYVAAGELVAMQSGVGLAATSAGYVLAILVMSRIVGTLLHQRRREVGIQTHFSEEQEQAKQINERQSEIAEELKDISLKCRSEGIKVAWPILERQMKRHAYRDDDMYFDGLKELADRRLLYRFASGYIDRLLPERPSFAWGVLEAMFEESGGKFQFHAGGVLFKLVDTAEHRSQRRILLRLFEKFENTFPDHPRLKEALLKGAEQALILDEMESGQRLFERAMALPGEADPSLITWCQKQLSH